MPHTTFDPRRHGFHFANAFENVTVFGKVTPQGLCGGMAYASLDYFLAGIPVPTHTKSDFGSAHEAPPDGSRLYKYFYLRIFDSYVNQWEQWMNVALNPRFNPVKFTQRHLPDLLGRLDLGQPVPLGLVRTTKLFEVGSNHQVLAIGYEISADGNSLTIDLYDNVYPDVVCTLTTNPKTIASVSQSPGKDCIAFFPLLDYRAHVPDYIDLGLAAGLDVERTGPGVKFVVPSALRRSLRRPSKGLEFVWHVRGESLVSKFTVQNFGEFPAHWNSLELMVTDPDGAVTTLGAKPSATLAAGARSGFTHTQPNFGEEPGIYECRPRYVSGQGFPIVLPEVTAGTSNREYVTVVPPGTVFPPVEPEPEKKAPARVARGKSKRPAARRSR